MKELNLEEYIIYLKKYRPFILQHLEYCFILAKTLKLDFIRNSIVTNSRFRTNQKVDLNQSVQYVQQFLKKIDKSWADNFSKMLQQKNCYISFLNQCKENDSRSFVIWNPQKNQIEIHLSLHQDVSDGKILIHESMHYENVNTHLSDSMLSEFFSFWIENQYLQHYKDLDMNWFQSEKQNRYYNIMVMSSICSDVFLLLLSNQKYGDTTYSHCQEIASSFDFSLDKEYFESSKRFIEFCLNHTKRFSEVDVTEAFNYVYSFVAYLLVKHKKVMDVQNVVQINKKVREADSVQKKVTLLQIDSEIWDLSFIQSCFKEEIKSYRKQKSR